MRHIKSSEAKTHLAELLDAVENGETVIVTRHGRPIARIVPEEQLEGERRREAVETIRKLRKAMPKQRISVDEILAWRDEGRH